MREVQDAIRDAVSGEMTPRSDAEFGAAFVAIKASVGSRAEEYLVS